MAQIGLAEVIPEGDYRFRMGIERENPEAFFRPTSMNEPLLLERRQWLEKFPDRHAALLPEGEKLLEETIRFARESGVTAPTKDIRGNTAATSSSQLLALGCTWEPDFLLLQLAPDGAIQLVGGCVCLPSSWSLKEKVGHGIEAIHGVVPGLNSAIGAQIRAFLGKLRVGTTWSRSNWGLSRSSELNQHPARGLPRLDAEITPEEVWLRVEHQAFVALPQANGVLFGIRIAMHPLNEIRQDRTLSARLALALRTMPEEVASYKGLAKARETLLGFLKP